MSAMSTPARVAASLLVLGSSIAGGLISVSRVPIPDAPAIASGPRVIDLNSAPAAELELLPRIGPALSARIIADREARGPFASLDDLQRVRGIGPVTVRRLKGLADALPIR
ncbi:MAG: ComEA family DNA-binding protein [Phycisphaerales bacterium]